MDILIHMMTKKTITCITDMLIHTSTTMKKTITCIMDTLIRMDLMDTRMNMEQTADTRTEKPKKQRQLRSLNCMTRKGKLKFLIGMRLIIL